MNRIKNFEKNLSKNFDYNFDKNQDSDAEELNIEDDVLNDPLVDKNQIISRYKILQDKIIEKNSQIKQLQFTLDDMRKKQKEILDNLSKDQSLDIKDKKLIELSKKNQDLKLNLEKFKLKEKDFEKKINELNTEISNLNILNHNSDKNISNILSVTNSETDGLNIIELKKKIKLSDSKIADIRNKLQLSKEENSKLNILIKREIGENIEIDKALKDKTYWKGKSEIIEILKTKIKILESQLGGSFNMGSNNTNLSIISEEGKRTPTGGNKSVINNPSLYQEYKKEKEILKSEIDKIKEENLKLNTENNRLKLRREVLEKEIKQQKEDLTSKIKILLEKSDNDEKLIMALNRELEKKGKGLFTTANDENSNFNLQQEITKLRNEIKEKESYINNINTVIMADGNGFNNKDPQAGLQTFSKIIIKLKELEDENKKLKLKSEDGKIYESLAKENAKLRLRVKELEDKLCER